MTRTEDSLPRPAPSEIPSPSEQSGVSQQELEKNKLAQDELAARIQHDQLEFAGKAMSSVAEVTKPILNHYANKATRTHDYELKQKELDEASRRSWDARFLQSLAEGNCGYIENVENYKEYCKEVIRRNPAAEFSHGEQMKKCREEALLRQRRA